MKKTWLILAVIAATVLIAYFNLSIRFFNDGVFPLVLPKTVLAYDDKTDGGTSEVAFESNDSLLNFSCTLGENEKGGWCGLIFDLRLESEDEKKVLVNRDWSFVDSVIFELESSGTKEILVKIWTFDPEVTDTNVARSYRLLMKEIPLSGGFQRISVPMEQFYTPQFWYQDNKVDASLVDRHQESVVRLEIAPGWNQPKGRRFSLGVKRIAAKGLSNFTFGVVLFIMLVLTIVAVGRRHSVHHD